VSGGRWGRVVSNWHIVIKIHPARLVDSKDQSLLTMLMMIMMMIIVVVVAVVVAAVVVVVMMIII